MAQVIESALALLTKAAGRFDAVTVAFSGGKDSLAVLDLCLRTFKRIEAFYMFLVPGLECEEQALAEAEVRFGITIRRYPHWLINKYLASGIYGFEAIWESELAEWKLADIYAFAMLDCDTAYVATGAKAADSGWRRRFMNTAKFDDVIYPIAEWHKYDVIAYLRARGIPVPASSGRSATGIDLSTPSLLWLHDTHPADFKRLCRYFPFAEAVVWRRTFYGETA